MAQIHNHDLAGDIARVDKFAYELHKSASSGVTEMNVYDQECRVSFRYGFWVSFKFSFLFLLSASSRSRFDSN